MDNREKERRFKYPAERVVGFNRRLSAVTADGIDLAAAAMEAGRVSFILLCAAARDRRLTRRRSIRVNGALHAVSLAASPVGDVAALWTVFLDGCWHLRVARVNPATLRLGRPRTLRRSSSLLTHVHAVFDGADLHVVWTEAMQDVFRIRIVSRRDGRWRRPLTLSDAGIDAFRPCVCASPDGPFVAWDQYNAGTYALAWCNADDSASRRVHTASKAGQRWFSPHVAVWKSRPVMVWLASREVGDARGIVDHAFACIGGTVEGGRVRLFKNAGTGSPRILADLRDGLLPARVYKGYLGLRRNPMLSLDNKGALHLLWEVRPESTNTAVEGFLVGRTLGPKGAWSAVRRYASGGYGYAVAPHHAAGTVAVARFVFDAQGPDVVTLRGVRLTGAGVRPHPRVRAERWAHWKPRAPAPPAKPRSAIKVDGRVYRLFWADTHCHSVFSGDAEGEPDELIHYARDRAGLDAACLIDNDYYPHKTLSPADWEVHKALSRHFTEPGRFVLFSGYEFTFHRADLEPDFNHRCVIYPNADGPLLRRIDPGSRTDRQLAAKLRGQPVISYPHHPTYRIIDNEVERNVEVCSSWRVCIEEHDHTIEQLKRGLKLGFVGSSDSHRATPGLGGAWTGLYATALTPDALYEAYRARRTIATQGIPMFVDFRVNDTFIGGEGTGTHDPVLRVKVRAPATLRRVSVFRDGHEIVARTPTSRACAFRVTDRGVGSGRHFYFVRVQLAGADRYDADPGKSFAGPFRPRGRYPHNLACARGRLAWTSPVWFDRA